MKTQPHDNSNYTQDFLEHQEKQYSPGYYLGGKLPLMFKAKTKAGAYWLIFLAIMYVVSLIVSTVSTQTGKTLSITNTALGVVLIGLTFFAAKRMLDSRRKNKPTR